MYHGCFRFPPDLPEFLIIISATFTPNASRRSMVKNKADSTSADAIFSLPHDRGYLSILLLVRGIRGLAYSQDISKWGIDRHSAPTLAATELSRKMLLKTTKYYHRSMFTLLLFSMVTNDGWCTRTKQRMSHLSQAQDSLQS